MSDLLLSSEKRARFEEMMERAIEAEFDGDADVLVRSNGRVFVREAGSTASVAGVILEDEQAVFDALRELEYEYEQSQYRLVADGEKTTGASFALERDGW